MKRIWQRIRLAIAIALAPVAAFATSGVTVQESVTTAAGEEMGTEIGRAEMTCINLDATNPIYCGYTSAVTSTTGQRIAAGDGYTWDAVADGQPVAGGEIFCRSTGGTVTVSCDQVIR